MGLAHELNMVLNVQKNPTQAAKTERDMYSFFPASFHFCVCRLRYRNSNCHVAIYCLIEHGASPRESDRKFRRFLHRKRSSNVYYKRTERKLNRASQLDNVGLRDSHAGIHCLLFVRLSLNCRYPTQNSVAFFVHSTFEQYVAKR